MKLNIASPTCGTQKLFEIEENRKVIQLYEKRISDEFEGDILGEQFKGYVFKITGGCDKDGFTMKQGVLTSARVALLVARGEIGYNAWRGKDGARRRKSIRGCIVGPDTSVLNLVIVHEGEEKLEGLTDKTVPRRLGPKRASKIRKLFALSKDDDVRKFVIRRQLPEKDGKKARSKAPKIQRLVTPVTLQRRRRKLSMIKQKRVKSREEREAYQRRLDRRSDLAAQRKRARKMRTMLSEKKKEVAAVAQAAAKEKREAEARAAAQKKSKAAPKAAAKKGGKGGKK